MIVFANIAFSDTDNVSGTQPNTDKTTTNRAGGNVTSTRGDFAGSSIDDSVLEAINAKKDNIHVYILVTGSDKSVAEEYEKIVSEYVMNHGGSVTIEKYPDQLPDKYCENSDLLRIYIKIKPNNTDPAEIQNIDLGHVLPCGREASEVVEAEYSKYLIHTSEEYVDIGIVAIHGDAAKKEMGEFLGAIFDATDEQKDDETDLEPPPEITEKHEVPDEQYAAIFVETEESINFKGEEYEPHCGSGICVITIPKSEILDKPLDMQGNNIIDYGKESIKVYDLGKTVITRRTMLKEKDRVEVYVAKGYLPVAMDVNVPKIDGRVPEIAGRPVFLDVDPVLRVFLKVYDGNIATQQIIVERDANIIDEKIRFAACSLYVENLVVETVKDDKYNIIIRFQITDGGDVVYIQNVRAKIGGKNVIPQYDEGQRVYTATASTQRGVRRIEIIGEADGCPAIYHVQEVYVGPDAPNILFAVITIIAAVAVAYVSMKIVFH